jgi:hypothetical protein
MNLCVVKLLQLTREYITSQGGGGGGTVTGGEPKVAEAKNYRGLTMT